MGERSVQSFGGSPLQVPEHVEDVTHVEVGALCDQAMRAGPQGLDFLDPGARFW